MTEREKSLLKQSAYRQAVGSNRGSILIISLWTLFLLTSFAVYLGEGIRQKIILVKRLEERDMLHYVSEAGIKRAITELKKMPQNTYSTLMDPWAKNESAFFNVKVGRGRFNVYTERKDDLTGLINRQYGLSDEESKININRIDESTLRRFFQVIAEQDEVEAQELAAAIVDWRDADSQLSIPLGSAEDSYYKSLRYSYEAKDAEFDVIDELLLVKGVTRELFEKVRDFITIYGEGRVNINTASKGILYALGLNKNLVESILEYRRGEDGTVGTEDDNFFKSTANILPKLSQNAHLGTEDVAILSRVIETHITTVSEFFEARSMATFHPKGATHSIRAVVHLYGDVLYWQEM